MDEHMCLGLPDLPAFDNPRRPEDNHQHQDQNHIYNTCMGMQLPCGQYQICNDTFAENLYYANEIQYSEPFNLQWTDPSFEGLETTHCGDSFASTSHYDPLALKPSLNVRGQTPCPPSASFKSIPEQSTYLSAPESSHENQQSQQSDEAKNVGVSNYQMGTFFDVDNRKLWHSHVEQQRQFFEHSHSIGISPDAITEVGSRWADPNSLRQSGSIREPGKIAVVKSIDALQHAPITKNSNTTARSNTDSHPVLRKTRGYSLIAPKTWLNIATNDSNADIAIKTHGDKMQGTPSAPGKNLQQMGASSSDAPFLAPVYVSTSGRPKAKTKRSTTPSIPLSCPRISQKPDPRLSADVCSREASDDFLVKSKLSGMSYKDIKIAGHFTEAESTLRGRFRTLIKPKGSRVRRPQWTESDIHLLREAVQHFCSPLEAQSQPARGSSPATRGPPSSSTKRRMKGMSNASTEASLNSSSSSSSPSPTLPLASPAPSPRTSLRSSSPAPGPTSPTSQSRLPGLMAVNLDVSKIPWKLVAEYIGAKGRYQFGYATCRKKWDEICAADTHGGSVVDGNDV